MKTKKLLFTAIATIVFIAGANAQNVNIPDANFKAALVANASVNTNMDAEIQVIEASVFNGAINVSQLNITDLTGIEEFVALDYLDCSRNYISGLDVSANIALTYLDCSGNYLPGSSGFNGYNNDYVYYLDTLDVSANIAITILKCNNNGLLSLNTTGLTALTYIDCSFNSRLYFAVSAKAAPVLYHSSSPLLNFSSNTALNYLNCSSNALSSLDVSENTALTYLDCSNYNWSEDEIMVEGGVTLSSLNLSANTALTYLNCIGNVLSSLDLSTCTELTFLDCSYNQLTSLDVSVCTALTTLNCSGNDLTNLNVSGCTALTSLNCSGNQYANQLTSLDVSACTALTTLDCSGNQLTILNASGCTALTSLNCSGNQLTSLDVKNGNNINMVTFSAFVNPNLSCIEVDDVAWSNSNWANNINATASFSLNCSGAGISDINESKALMFYPNPTTGSIYLSEPGNITLTDLSGNLLLEQKNTNQLDISALPSGIYFLHFGENTKQTFKVIKE